jgi:hypothetical protein
MGRALALAGILLTVALRSFGQGFAVPGAPEPVNVGDVAHQLADDGASMELLISFGTSKGGSAGHLALALTDEAGEERVHSANFYADREQEHMAGFVASPLMLAIPKREYLYGTSSTLGEKASFGLDYGEVYKRSVVAIRVFGVPLAQRRALASYLERMNGDFDARRRDTEYQRGEVKYGYMDLNCAKTIGSAFRYGAGYDAVKIRSTPRFAWRKAARALSSNTPSEMAMQLLREFDRRGYAMDVVLYRKYPASAYVDPHDDRPVAFRDLPDRFPSAISLDFRNDDGAYEDYDNLFALYLLHNLQRYTVTLDPATQHLVLESRRGVLPYALASRAAARDAQADSHNFMRRLLVPARGRRVDEGITAPQP